MTVVIDCSFFEESFINECLFQCGLIDPIGDVEQYIEWNTGYNFSSHAKALSDALLTKGIPKDIPILLKMYTNND